MNSYTRIITEVWCWKLRNSFYASNTYMYMFTRRQCFLYLLESAAYSFISLYWNLDVLYLFSIKQDFSDLNILAMAWWSAYNFWKYFSLSSRYSQIAGQTENTTFYHEISNKITFQSNFIFVAKQRKTI